jgi:hypothetical protein
MHCGAIKGQGNMTIPNTGITLEELLNRIPLAVQYIDKDGFLRYPGYGIISGKNEKIFQAWDKADPEDEWECERASQIAKIQGNVNLVVDQAFV